MSTVNIIDISEYLSDFSKFVLTKYSINGSKEAVYILYNDILKLHKLCESIIYNVRISNKQFNQQEMLSFIQLIEFKDKLNILCKRWDEKSWNWVFRYTGNSDSGIASKLEVVLDSTEVNGKHQYIMYYKDLINLFHSKENFFMKVLKTKEVIDNSISS